VLAWALLSPFWHTIRPKGEVIMSIDDLSAAKRIAIEARRSIPPALLTVSGRALYSPASTLISGSPFYFLGVNPGEVPGATQLHSNITVEADLHRLETGTIIEHGYLDEQWKGNMAGNAPIQVRGQKVFAILAEGSIADGKALLRITPTSNFVLQRSTSVVTLQERTGANAGQLALIYWPFHQAIIRETGCKVVITHAVVLARTLAKALRWGQGWERPSGWGGTLSTCCAWQIPRGPMLLAIPNLSRYIPDGPREQALKAFFREFVPQ
jgi:hypothetical protein